MTEAVQKQQKTRDEVQQRIEEETSIQGCHKQRLKELKKRLRMEDTQLQKKLHSLKEAQSLRDRWQGERLSMKGKEHVMHPA